MQNPLECCLALAPPRKFCQIRRSRRRLRPILIDDGYPKLFGSAVGEEEEEDEIEEGREREILTCGGGYLYCPARRRGKSDELVSAFLPFFF